MTTPANRLKGFAETSPLTANVDPAVRMTAAPGYGQRAYAQALDEFGHPRRLEHCGGWILERPIAGTDRHDAMSPYPFFTCEDIGALEHDLAALERSGLVSVVLISDPFTDAGVLAMSSRLCQLRPLKTHYLADLSTSGTPLGTAHHRYYARRAARHMEIDTVSYPVAYLDEWEKLYAQLVARHHIVDLRKFSRRYFSRLLGLPGVLMQRALYKGRAVGAQILLLQNDVAHSHLAAFTSRGYALGASYLLDAHAITSLRTRVRYINWGGGMDGRDGLARYKRGWSNLQRQSWIIGSILDQDAYRALCSRNSAPPDTTPYFPAYRIDEFKQSASPGGQPPAQAQADESKPASMIALRS